jgi:hypothetical protein
MEDSLTTPMKAAHVISKNNDVLMQTPINMCPQDSNDRDDCNMLETSFSGMKIDNNIAGALKRTADLMTIEGTPVNLTKRMDLNPTPNAKFQSIHPPTLPIFTASNDGNEECTRKNSAVTNVKIMPQGLQVPSPRKVLVISSGSDDHNTGEHQENALRTALLCGTNGCLRRDDLEGSIIWAREDNVRPAAITDLLRVHEYAYLSHLEAKCLSSINTTQTTERQNQVPIPSFYAPVGNLDGDTPLVPQSLDASRRYCGAAMMAVDALMSGRYGSDADNGPSHAFVLGRPPGHHTGPSGCVPSDYFWKRPDMASSGFCLLNTVAVTAAYARYRYGRNFDADSQNDSRDNSDNDNSNNNINIYNNINNNNNNCNNISHNNNKKNDNNNDNHHSNNNKNTNSSRHRSFKVAIVDIDVHHGNGTEEIVRNLRYVRYC